jgi:hypothetical protein
MLMLMLVVLVAPSTSVVPVVQEGEAPRLSFYVVNCYYRCRHNVASRRRRHHRHHTKLMGVEGYIKQDPLISKPYYTTTVNVSNIISVGTLSRLRQDQYDTLAAEDPKQRSLGDLQ